MDAGTLIKLKASYKITEEAKVAMKQRERDQKEAAKRKVLLVTSPARTQHQFNSSYQTLAHLHSALSFAEASQPVRCSHSRYQHRLTDWRTD